MVCFGSRVCMPEVFARYQLHFRCHHLCCVNIRRIRVSSPSPLLKSVMGLSLLQSHHFLSCACIPQFPPPFIAYSCCCCVGGFFSSFCFFFFGGQCLCLHLLSVFIRCLHAIISLLRARHVTGSIRPSVSLCSDVCRKNVLFVLLR